MMKNIVSQVIDKAVGQITDIFKMKLKTFIEERNKNAFWNNVVQEAIKATEGIDEEIGRYIFSRLSIVGLERQLFDEITIIFTGILY